MTDEQIATQLIDALEKSLVRFNAAKPKKRTEVNKAVAAEFLSGANQAANFLVRADGLVTPQQLERALKIVGEAFGFELKRPE